MVKINKDKLFLRNKKVFYKYAQTFSKTSYVVSIAVVYFIRNNKVISEIFYQVSHSFQLWVQQEAKQSIL